MFYEYFILDLMYSAFRQVRNIIAMFCWAAQVKRFCDMQNTNLRCLLVKKFVLLNADELD